MKIAVIDNMDSFVYNLVQYLGILGAEPSVFRNDSEIESIEEIQPDGIVISPGPRVPSEAGVSKEVVKELGPNTPTLGVCLGHQVIAHVFGGSVAPAERLMHGKTSMIVHDGNDLYRNISNPFEATRYHSLVVDRDSLPESLRVVARTDDDYGEVMGIEHVDYPISGVQFHPESILTSQGMRIVKNFLKGVKE